MSFPIVGARFRSPAKAILQALPLGATLWLTPEPDNQFDQNAIRVSVKTSDIPQASREELEVLLPGYGMELSEVLAEPEWHLGYIPARIALNLSLTEPVSGTLGFDAKGWPEMAVEDEIPGRPASGEEDGEA